jgi:hypothetical protein
MDVFVPQICDFLNEAQVESSSPAAATTRPLLKKLHGWVKKAFRKHVTELSLAKRKKATKLRKLAEEKCEEMPNSFSPTKMRNFIIKARLRDESLLMSLFCSMVSLSEHLSDSSQVGVYSNTVEAVVYRTAAYEMRKVFVATIFSPPEFCATVRSFFAEWALAEDAVSDHDLKVLDALDNRDKPAFFFWLVNERALSLRRQTDALADGFALLFFS